MLAENFSIEMRDNLRFCAKGVKGDGARFGLTVVFFFLLVSRYQNVDRFIRNKSFCYHWGTDLYVIKIQTYVHNMYVSIIYKICLLKTSKYVGKKIKLKKNYNYLTIKMIRLHWIITISFRLSNIECRLLDLKIFLKRPNDRSTSTYIGWLKHVRSA
jgi:hypothetical protein